jgi:hypothetical protein
MPHASRVASFMITRTSTDKFKQFQNSSNTLTLLSSMVNRRCHKSTSFRLLCDMQIQFLRQLTVQFNQATPSKKNIWKCRQLLGIFMRSFSDHNISILVLKRTTTRVIWWLERAKHVLARSDQLTWMLSTVSRAVSARGRRRNQTCAEEPANVLY